MNFFPDRTKENLASPVCLEQGLWAKIVTKIISSAENFKGHPEQDISLTVSRSSLSPCTTRKVVILLKQNYHNPFSHI